MRFPIAAVVLMALPMTAAAQSRTGDQAALPVLPPLGLPLAPIGLPLPSIGLPPINPQRVHTPPPRGRDHGGPRPGPRHNGRLRLSVVYVVPAYDWPLATSPVVAAAVIASEPAAAAASDLDVRALATRRRCGRAGAGLRRWRLRRDACRARTSWSSRPARIASSCRRLDTRRWPWTCESRQRGRSTTAAR